MLIGCGSTGDCLDCPRSRSRGGEDQLLSPDVDSRNKSPDRLSDVSDSRSSQISVDIRQRHISEETVDVDDLKGDYD